MKNNNTYCVNPYLNLSVQPNGTIKPCCMSTVKYVTDSKKTTLNHASILEFWNSEKRKQMIADLNNGIQIPECSSCWKEEIAGKESKRIRDNKSYQDKELSEDMLPVVVDLSMGNLCNIKCRICSPWHSTPWLMEQAKINSPKNPKEYTNQLHWISFKESFDYSNKFFWDDIENLLLNAERLDFAGGEPFYIDKHWNIVRLCVENGYSKNQHIHYNTNGTIFPEKYIDLLDQFKIIDIQVSSDGVGEKFEYMRHPAKWDIVENTIDQLCTVRDNSNSEWIIGACLSVSAFNIFDIFETFEHYASKNDVRIYINIVHDHHGVRVLPIALREIIIKKLESTQSKFKPGQWEKEKSMICNHLQNSPFNQHDWQNFWKETKMRDGIRNESFEETFPEYFNYMKNFIG
jgi:radical SAM protein with 4Fe4S-binding SPASM domain